MVRIPNEDMVLRRMFREKRRREFLERKRQDALDREIGLIPDERCPVCNAELEEKDDG